MTDLGRAPATPRRSPSAPAHRRSDPHGAYPIWAVFAVPFDLLAIYAPVVHGSDGKALRVGRE